jgi:hypothetical protein
VRNGLELLADEKDPEMRKRCFELLEQSAKISTDKLKFFRLAYGAAGGFGDEVPAQEPKELITALVARGVGVSPIVLHAGVGSLETGELPTPEPFRVPATPTRVRPHGVPT